jgi:hypothetical protein
MDVEALGCTLPARKDEGAEEEEFSAMADLPDDLLRRIFELCIDDGGFVQTHTPDDVLGDDILQQEGGLAADTGFASRVYDSSGGGGGVALFPPPPSGLLVDFSGTASSTNVQLANLELVCKRWRDAIRHPRFPLLVDLGQQVRGAGPFLRAHAAHIREVCLPLLANEPGPSLDLLEHCFFSPAAPPHHPEFTLSIDLHIGVEEGYGGGEPARLIAFLNRHADRIREVRLNSNHEPSWYEVVRPENDNFLSRCRTAWALFDGLGPFHVPTMLQELELVLFSYIDLIYDPTFLHSDLGPTLRRLEVKHCLNDVLTLPLRPALGALSALTSLSFNHMYGNSNNYRIEGSPESDRVGLLPNLRRLELGRVDDFNVLDAVLSLFPRAAGVASSVARTADGLYDLPPLPNLRDWSLRTYTEPRSSIELSRIRFPLGLRRLSVEMHSEGEEDGDDGGVRVGPNILLLTKLRDLSLHAPVPPHIATPYQFIVPADIATALTALTRLALSFFDDPLNGAITFQPPPTTTAAAAIFPSLKQLELCAESVLFQGVLDRAPALESLNLSVNAERCDLLAPSPLLSLGVGSGLGTGPQQSRLPPRLRTLRVRANFAPWDAGLREEPVHLVIQPPPLPLALECCWFTVDGPYMYTPLMSEDGTSDSVILRLQLDTQTPRRPRTYVILKCCHELESVAGLEITELGTFASHAGFADFDVSGFTCEDLATLSLVSRKTV